MRDWIGRKVFRLGLWLMGFRPSRTVLFSCPGWDAAKLARWTWDAGQHADEVPGGVLIPFEIAPEYDSVSASP